METTHHGPLFAHRKLEQDHKEKLAAVRWELVEEMEQLKQQAGLQRQELEAEVQKIREDESFLRDHLSISLKVAETSGTWWVARLHIRKEKKTFLSSLSGEQTSGNGAAGQHRKTDGGREPSSQTADQLGRRHERAGRALLAGDFFFSLFYLRLTLVIFSEVWRLRPRQRRFLPPRRANETTRCRLQSPVQGNGLNQGSDLRSILLD